MYLGIDVHKRYAQVAVMDEAGEIVAKQTPSTTTPPPTTTVVTTHTDTATPTSVPGFGIAASVVALLLGALGLRRRQ